MEKSVKAQLILENGTSFPGRAFGYLKESVGEVIFYSGSAGYQEVLTDPALAGQIVVLNYPLMGNYGVNLDDSESEKPRFRGLVVREACDNPSNWRCEMDLDGFLKQHKIMGIQGIDTRALTQVIRDNGSMKGILTIRPEHLSQSQLQQKLNSIGDKNAVYEVSRENVTVMENRGRNLGVLDLGIKKSTVKELMNRDFKLTVFPANTTAEEIDKAGIAGLFLSGGPGNPNELDGLVRLVKHFLSKLPVAGIGLGHEITALALGCTVDKLKYGHHGPSYPVKNLKTGRVHITSQNHSYCVTDTTGDVEVTFRNINDNTIEGIASREKNVYSVQFTPETMAFEGHTGFFYDTVKSMVEISKEAGKNA